MARTRIDLNRFKKVYPLQRKSPRWYTQNIESFGYTLSFTSEDRKSIETTDVNSPVVVITGVGPDVNVNIWVAELIVNPTTGVWTVIVEASSAFTGDVHILVTDGAP